MASAAVDRAISGICDRRWVVVPNRGAGTEWLLALGQGRDAGACGYMSGAYMVAYQRPSFGNRKSTNRPGPPLFRIWRSSGPSGSRSSRPECQRSISFLFQ